jgi:hypothetical protein
LFSYFFGTLLLKPYHNKQEAEELLLKLYTWLRHQGTYPARRG